MKTNCKEITRKAGEMMEQQDNQIQDDLEMGGKIKSWLQDNIRIIVSVLIVVAIAGGIYSYSKRGQEPTEEELALQEIQMEGEKTNADSGVTVVGEEDKKPAEKENQQPTDAVIEENAQPQPTATPNPTSTPKEDVKVETGTKTNNVVVQGGSQETSDAFVETAETGDSLTTLSRKALKNYLEKNNDSALTAEHKIYIEDYLRRKVDHSGKVLVGDEISFSKMQIKDAIEKAKTLNDNQLENLKKYSARVSLL